MAKKIMVVDDQESLIELVTEILEQEGYEVIPAFNGEECLDKLKMTKPDLVIIDMMMPRMSGRELCEMIRKNSRTKDMKIAFLTVARFSDIGKKILKDMNVLDYITKPFDNQDFINRVKKMVE